MGDKPNMKECSECNLYKNVVHYRIVDYYYRRDLKQKEEYCGVKREFDKGSTRWERVTTCTRNKGHDGPHMGENEKEDGKFLDIWDDEVGEVFQTPFGVVLKMAKEDGFEVE